MGNFFTSTQIYNEGMVKSEKFIDMFCKAMKKEGYVTCEGDESEKSYILRFADNCRWVTIASEDYDEGNAATDAGKIAKMLDRGEITLITCHIISHKIFLKLSSRSSYFHFIQPCERRIFRQSKFKR